MSSKIVAWISRHSSGDTGTVPQHSSGDTIPNSIRYDLNGNLTADGKRTYVYDIENRLVSATPLPGSDAVAADLVYDPLGRLFQVASPITGTRRFLYDGDALVAEYDGATDAMIRRHVHWPGADLPMVTYEGAGLATIRQLLADHQGSIVALADASGVGGDPFSLPLMGRAGVGWRLRKRRRAALTFTPTNLPHQGGGV